MSTPARTDAEPSDTKTFDHRPEGREIEMLEQIHAAAEDQRKTQVIVALAMVIFGVYALVGVALGSWSAVTMVGLLLGSAGAAMLSWARARATFATKHFAH